jgi:FkbM family methyltransferase
MKQIIKTIFAGIANSLNEMRGYRFPDYFCERDRVQVLLFGIEPDISHLFKKQLKEGMTMLDVGGNVGLICRLCAKKVGRTGKIVTFEPDPYTRGFLEHNVKDQGNVIVSPIALSNEDTMAKFHLHPQSGTSNSLVAFDGAKEIVDVECKKIDTYLSENPGLKPDYIKIDVEGAELKVLGGMREAIKNFPDLKIVIEYCPENLANAGVTPDDYYSFLDNLGLASEIIRKDGSTQPISDLTDLIAKLGTDVYCNLLCYRKS